jgi:hypothetical protein
MIQTIPAGQFRESQRLLRCTRSQDLGQIVPVIWCTRPSGLFSLPGTASRRVMLVVCVGVHSGLMRVGRRLLPVVDRLGILEVVPDLGFLAVCAEELAVVVGVVVLNELLAAVGTHEARLMIEAVRAARLSGASEDRGSALAIAGRWGKKGGSKKRTTRALSYLFWGPKDVFLARDAGLRAKACHGLSSWCVATRQRRRKMRFCDENSRKTRNIFPLWLWPRCCGCCACCGVSF